MKNLCKNTLLNQKFQTIMFLILLQKIFWKDKTYFKKRKSYYKKSKKMKILKINVLFNLRLISIQEQLYKTSKINL